MRCWIRAIRGAEMISLDARMPSDNTIDGALSSPLHMSDTCCLMNISRRYAANTRCTLIGPIPALCAQKASLGFQRIRALEKAA